VVVGFPPLYFLVMHDIMTQTTLFPLKAMGAEGEIKKGLTALWARQGLHYAPFLLGQESPALIDYAKEPLSVSSKQESGFLLADISV
jgi:hypothetical protein